MGNSSISAAHTIETFFLFLVGIGPKLALLPYLSITASLDPPTQVRVRRQMLATAATVSVVLIVLGELLAKLLHFTVGSLSIAGGVILLVLAVRMVLETSEPGSPTIAGTDPVRLARVPLAVPYLLNPVGIVALITISAQAKSWSVFVVELALLALVLVLDAAVFRWANIVGHGLDEGRMLVIEKVFGFLIGAIAVQLVLDGLFALGVTTHH
jgi:multiple antibiotic resistance protein